MLSKIPSKLIEYKFLAAGFLWLMVWLLPWNEWIVFNWFRVAASIALFIVPGMLFSLLLTGKNITLPAHVISGLAFSILWVSLLGLLGRVLQLPFSYIKPVFVVIGLVLFILAHRGIRPGEERFRRIHLPLPYVALLVLLAGMSIFITLQDRFGGDDQSYLAYLTNWQHAQPLDFTEVVLGTGQLDEFRFWVAMFPMNLAFLSETSGVHGLLLIGYYIEPLFVVVALLAFFSLYEELLRSEKKAVAAILMQFAFFFLLRDSQQPGQSFFIRLSEDKAFAAFILAPSFFIAINIFRQYFSRRSALFVVFTGWALAIIHPIILAFTLFIAIATLFFIMIPQWEIKKFFLAMGLVFIVVTPVIPLRFDPSAPKAFELYKSITDGVKPSPENPGSKNVLKTRITWIEGTPFYGFQLERITIKARGEESPVRYWTFSLSYLWVMLLGFFWSLFNLKKHPVAPFMAASALLVLLCLIPYTGWLVGKVVTLRMLWRSPWMLPIGIFGVILLTELFQYAQSKMKPNRNLLVEHMVLVIALLVTGLSYRISVDLFAISWSKLENTTKYRETLGKQAALGEFLEDYLESPAVFVGSQRLMSLLPGLSSKADVFMFRTPQYTKRYGVERNYAMIERLLRVDQTLKMEDRIEMLRLYNVGYLLTEKTALKEIYMARPEYFSAKEVYDYWIIEFHDDIAP